MLLDADGEETQNVLVEALLPFDLGQGCRRGIDIHEREMRLAILAHPKGEGLDAPILGLGDRSSHLINDALELRRQFFDLLRADVLARDINMLVERHRPFPPFKPIPALSPSSPSGKARTL